MHRWSIQHCDFKIVRYNNKWWCTSIWFCVIARFVYVVLYTKCMHKNKTCHRTRYKDNVCIIELVQVTINYYYTLRSFTVQSIYCFLDLATCFFQCIYVTLILCIEHKSLLFAMHQKWNMLINKRVFWITNKKWLWFFYMILKFNYYSGIYTSLSCIIIWRIIKSLLGNRLDLLHWNPSN